MTQHQHLFEAIGTNWAISTAAPLTAETLTMLHGTVEDFDGALSRFRPDSGVSRLARTGGTVRLPDNAAPLLAFYRKLYDVTQGKVSPLIGQALAHLGYDAGYTLQRGPGTVAVPSWDDVLTVDGSVVTATDPVMLDLGAAGKGYLVDLLAEILTQNGTDEYLIDASGDIAACGPEICRVGLEHPADPSKVIGVANLRNASLCGSAVNRRSWGDGLHHIIDTTTGEPSTGVVATWVIADTTMIADGLSTALFFTDPAVLVQDFAFSFVRMLAGGGVEYSRNFDGELFT